MKVVVIAEGSGGYGAEIVDYMTDFEININIWMFVIYLVLTIEMSNVKIGWFRIMGPSKQK